MTDITISSASFDALADYDVYSKDNISSIHWLQDHFYLNDYLGLDIMNDPNLSKWLLSVDHGALDLSTHRLEYLNLDHVTSIREGGFYNGSIGRLSMKSIFQLNYGSFDSIVIEDIVENGFKNLGEINSNAFVRCQLSSNSINELLKNIDFIDTGAFQDCSIILPPYQTSLNFPRCKKFGNENQTGGIFMRSEIHGQNVSSLYAPELTSIDGQIFMNCPIQLCSIIAPKLKHLGDSAFSTSYFRSFDCLNSIQEFCSNSFTGILGLTLSDTLDLNLPNAIYLTANGVNNFSDEPYFIKFHLPKLSSINGEFYYSSLLKLLDFTGNSNFSFKNDATFRSTYTVSDHTEIIYDDEPVELIINGDKYVNANTLTGDVSFTIDWSTMHITGYTQTGKQRTIDGEQLENKKITTIKGYSKCKCSTIGSFALTDCNQLTSVDIRSPLTIQDDAFASANLLQTVIVPRVKSIGQNAFANCPWLNTLDIHESKYSSLSSDDNYVGDMIEYWGISTSQSSLVIECYDGQYSPKA